MKNACVIGVDGGNSKTDYYLFDLDGRKIDSIRSGTCSHEQFKDGYISAKRVMGEQLGLLLSRNGLRAEDAAAAAFGLAGADIASQKASLNRIIGELGFARFAMDNDSFLGVKAGSESGSGICSINGSGACTGGISPSGRRLQIGGVGSELSGDEAGGYYLARRALRIVYDAFFRLGQPTAMTDPVMRLLGLDDKERYIEAVVEAAASRSLPYTELVTVLLEAAASGDEAAFAAVDHSARQMALSAAGCIRGLDFGEEPVDIVMAGSVWVKAASPIMRDRFRHHVGSLSGQECRYVLLEAPPAAGAVLWALELAHGKPAEKTVRERVLGSVQ
ncbi:N-acetylglucosamine kinase [Paenibacillus sp. D9]|uniref:N-acetylglucosamine kinase n=1 Tax=Paenibacillus sp. D9 TaxID=665792 RepID=UPI00061EACBF|nr:BadF/BadG/BcrA/BcrD ATPase family protein [Paenibacillus sp. D9]KKC48500.1 N-acetylglucosamine kinase [Paenibacillus sp. D9]